MLTDVDIRNSKGNFFSRDLSWRNMRKECGSCDKEHTSTIDDAIDKTLDSPI